MVGIGRGTVKGLVECGAEVIAVSRTQADLDSLQKEVCILCTHLLVSCDRRVILSAERGHSRVSGRLGRGCCAENALLRGQGGHVGEQCWGNITAEFP